MCKFKSGIIFKNRVVLAPVYNDSHSALLRTLKIEDNEINAMKMFVRAELVPPEGNKMAEISKWKFIVDQDVVPTWYEEDPTRYEEEFREAVSDYVKKNLATICGKTCDIVSEDEETTYYMLDDILFYSSFGKNNNYSESEVREKLQKCDFLKQLKEAFGDRLVSLTVDLTSLDGLKDYGKVEDDYLAIPSLDFYRNNRENISNCGRPSLLATANSTPSGDFSHYVHYVNSHGGIRYDWYCNEGGVRPYFGVKKSSNL